MAYPDAGLLVHPESPEEMIDEQTAVGSTTQLINAAAHAKPFHSSHGWYLLQNATAGPRSY